MISTQDEIINPSRNHKIPVKIIFYSMTLSKKNNFIHLCVGGRFIMNVMQGWEFILRKTLSNQAENIQ